MLVREERFWERVDLKSPGECWPWKGRLDHGYGRFGGRGAHRMSYELCVGPIPEGMEIDHLCFNTGCVNPSHLEAVSRQENMRRRHAHYGRGRCKNGHEQSPENGRWKQDDYGRRWVCRPCSNEWGRKHYRANRDRLRTRQRERYALKTAPLGALDG